MLGQCVDKTGKHSTYQTSCHVLCLSLVFVGHKSPPWFNVPLQQRCKCPNWSFKPMCKQSIYYRRFVLKCLTFEMFRQQSHGAQPVKWQVAAGTPPNASTDCWNELMCFPAKCIFNRYTHRSSGDSVLGIVSFRQCQNNCKLTLNCDRYVNNMAKTRSAKHSFFPVTQSFLVPSSISSPDNNWDPHRGGGYRSDWTEDATLLLVREHRQPHQQNGDHGRQGQDQRF